MLKSEHITPQEESIEKIMNEKMKQEQTIFWLGSISLTVFDLFQKSKLSSSSTNIPNRNETESSMNEWVRIGT